MNVLIADIIVVIHFAFICFVVAGGLLALRWPACAWVHLPAAAWGAAIEFGGWICPLTPLEQRLRIEAGQGVYETTFIEQYLMPVIYPAGLTREVQFLLGIAVIAVNILIYRLVFRRRPARPG